MSDPLVLLDKGKKTDQIQFRQEERGRARFSFEYKPASLIFWNADALEISNTISEMLYQDIRTNFLDSRDASGRKRRRKVGAGRGYRREKTEELRQAEKKQRITKRFIVEKYDIPPEWVSRTWKGLKAIEKKKTKQKKEELKNYKLRGKGVQYPDNWDQEGVIWSGLMFESFKMNKPRPGRKRYDKETRSRYWTKGRVRFSISKKRRLAAQKHKFFEFGMNSPTQNKIENFSRFMMRKAVTRRNYNQRRKLAKFAGRLIWKVIKKGWTM